MTLPSAGERVLIVGLGISGRALAEFMARRGVLVRVCDQRQPAALKAAVAGLPAGAETVLGGYDEAVLEGCTAVYASPAVAWEAPLLEAARSRGLPVSSEIDLFFKLCPAPIVGITGTNGKTTTTALTAEVLKRGRRPVLVGGNIGETVLDRLSEIGAEHWVVLELSSFQLQSCERPRSRIAAVLNISPDHLDRHPGMEAYTAAKARAVRFLEPEDAAVLNGLDPLCRSFAELTRASVCWFDRHRPEPPVAIPGPHNRLNALAAAAIGRLAGLDDAQVGAAIAGFRGVEHRLELVGEWGGRRWYNDSKATNPESGRVALDAFAGSPLVLIAGGRGGGFALDEWVAAVRRRTHAVVLIGESAEALEPMLAGHPAVRAGSLAEAVRKAAELAPPGAVILLSPAHKSFDMFQSYEDRGRRFKTAVQEVNS